MLNIRINYLTPIKTIGNIVYLFCQTDTRFMSTIIKDQKTTNLNFTNE